MHNQSALNAFEHILRNSSTTLGAETVRRALTDDSDRDPNIKNLVGRIKETLSNPPGEGEDDFHVAADKCLCDLLTALGYGDVVKLYDEVEKMTDISTLPPPVYQFPDPIPFSERDPSLKELSENGECWYFQAVPIGGGFWALVDHANGLWDSDRRDLFSVTHWLPYWAFPNPNEINPTKND